MRRATTLLVLVAALLVPASALAATARTTLPDVEDEVMCVECGTALNVSTSPVANQERALIRRLIDQGKTKAQIKAALVDSYGRDVLADPPDSGFGLAAWWIPVLLGPLALLVAFFAARRWRRSNAAAAVPDADPGLADADAKRLDAELAAFDR
jgi:cytochrome c-type biogenesis protein CcmH